jgi:hypothetical protein
MPNTESIVTKSAPNLDQQVKEAEKEIKMHEATIADLSAEGHEVADATRHLSQLLETLTDLLRSRMKAR